MSDEYTIVPLPWWFVLAVVLLFSCASCASERYLTEEQDAEMRKVCAPAGCEVIPSPIWEQIEAILKRAGAV